MQAVEMSLTVVVVLVLLALAFDFMNGFHDAANSIATIVSTGVLKPQHAVAWAAFFNVAAIAVFQLKVASTIGKGTIDPAIVDHYVVFGALIGAIAWNIITWYYGIPSSSSHALIGGLAGAAMAKAGTGSLVWAGIGKVVAFILVAPFLGFILGGTLMVVVSWLANRSTPRKVDKSFRRLQLLSAAAYSLGHGGNDAQKTIGIIWMLLLAAGTLKTGESVPMWVVISCYTAMGLGTMFGGWRIVKTMGQRITKLRPVGGFCAETGGAITLFMATSLGIPVSTTHTITGRHRRRRHVQGAEQRTLGRGRQHRLGLGIDHSGQRPDRRACLVDRPIGVVSHCQSCGACCANYRVSFPCREVDDQAGGWVPVALVEESTPHVVCMRGHGGRTGPLYRSARDDRGVSVLRDLRISPVGLPRLRASRGCRPGGTRLAMTRGGAMAWRPWW
jgi:PiT family inorganic phosphate transporter